MSEDKLEQLARATRQAFNEVESLIQEHRRTNVLPVIGATYIYRAVSKLLSNAGELQKLTEETLPLVPPEATEGYTLRTDIISQIGRIKRPAPTEAVEETP